MRFYRTSCQNFVRDLTVNVERVIASDTTDGFIYHKARSVQEQGWRAKS